MAKFTGTLVAAAIFVLGAASCSATSDEPSPGVLRQALTYCHTDQDCAYNPDNDISVGEHCGLDGLCHTIAEDPSCGLWSGEYPGCDYYPAGCRIAHCREPDATCDFETGFCHRGPIPPASNPCWPFYYNEPCPSECFNDGDCEPQYTCETTPSGGVCG